MNQSVIKRFVRVSTLTLIFPFVLIFFLLVLLVDVGRFFFDMIAGTIIWAFDNSDRSWSWHAYDPEIIKESYRDFVGIYIDLPKQ